MTETAVGNWKTASDPENNSFFTWLNQNKLYRTTPVSGFSLIAESKFTLETVVWYVVVGLLLALTIQNTTEVINEMREKPTLTTIEVMDPARGSVYLQDFRIHSTTPLAFFFADAIEEFVEQYNLTAEKVMAVTKAFSKEKFGPQFIKFDEQSDALLADKETLLGSSWNGSLLGMFTWNLCGNDDSNFLQEKLSSLNISGDEFYRKFNEELVSFYGLTLSDTDGNQAEYNITVKYPFGIRCTGVLVSTEFHVHLLKNYTRLKMRSFHSRRSFGREYFYEQLYKTVAVVQIVDLDSLNWFTTQPTVLAQNKILIQAKYHCDVESKCQPFRNAYECRDKCMLRKVINECGCRPATSFYLDPDSGDPWCPFSETKNDSCVNRNRTSEDCDAFCGDMRPCDQLFQQYQITNSRTPSGDPYEILAVMEIMNAASFLQFTEELRNSWYGFLAELGGILDLWIGASIIGAVHFIVYVSKQFVYICKRDKKTEAVQAMSDATRDFPIESPANYHNNNELGGDFLLQELQSQTADGQQLNTRKLLKLVEMQQKQIDELKLKCEANVTCINVQ